MLQKTIIDLYQLLDIPRSSAQVDIIEALAEYMKNDGDPKIILAVKKWLLDDATKLKYDMKLNSIIDNPLKKIDYVITNFKYLDESIEGYCFKGLPILSASHHNQCDLIFLSNQFKKNIFVPYFAIKGDILLSKYSDNFKLLLKFDGVSFPAQGIIDKSIIKEEYETFFKLSIDIEQKIPSEYVKGNFLQDIKDFSCNYEAIVSEKIQNSKNLEIQLLSSNRCSLNYTFYLDF
jgi:hypothetical protein